MCLRCDQPVHQKGYDQLLVVSDANESEYTGMDNLRGFKDAANDEGIPFKTYFIEGETTKEDIHDYLNQQISPYKKTLVYAADVEALRKVYLGIKLFPEFQTLFPERIGLLGFDSGDYVDYDPCLSGMEDFLSEAH